MSSPQHNPSDGVVHLIDGLLDRAIARRASDIHFEPAESGMRVRYRLDGLLHDVDSLPAGLADNLIARLKVLAGLLTYRTDIPQEGAFSRPVIGEPLKQPKGTRPPHASPAPPAPLDIRVATFPTVRGERAVVRLLYQAGPVSGLDGLGLSPQMVADLRRAACQPQGLILMTGPAGSGKSTTLYAVTRHLLASTPGRSVVSLEDPVEQRVEGMAQIQVSPHGELNYVRAMRSLLRQDVQVLLVGEIRDSETARIVVEASLTGHLIMSTLHSGDPAEAIVRLMEMGIPPYQLVGALSLICSQRLLRTVCPKCEGAGCEDCTQTGCMGRIACGQAAIVDETLRRAILAQTPAGELRRVIARNRPTLAADARRLVAEKRTTEEEVLRVLGTLE